MKPNDNTLQTTSTSLQVIETLRRQDGARVTELADVMEKSPSTIHGHLQTLHDAEFVVREGDVYQLSLRFLNLGEYVHNRKQVYQLAEPKVNQLADETGGRAHFIVEEHDKGVYVHTKSGKHAVETYSRVGRRHFLHTAAAGKSILAMLPEQKVEAIIDEHGLPEKTENTITDREELFKELAVIRDQGYAYNREEQIQGIKAVGTPILGDHDEVIGAISVSGPAHRLKGTQFEEELPNTVLGIGNELELEIEYS